MPREVVMIGGGVRPGHVTVESEGSRPGVLLVSEDPWSVAQWREWLEDAGYATASCAGPHLAWPCARFDGRPCPLRELADVAVIDVPNDGASELYAGWAERLCTTVPDDGATALILHEGLRLDLPPTRIRLRRPVSAPWLVAAVREALARRRRDGR
jgi:hypothetical protein